MGARYTPGQEGTKFFDVGSDGSVRPADKLSYVPPSQEHLVEIAVQPQARPARPQSKRRRGRRTPSIRARS